MPQALEEKLKRQARRKHLKGRHRDAYIYGGMRRAGWKPKKGKQK